MRAGALLVAALLAAPLAAADPSAPSPAAPPHRAAAPSPAQLMAQLRAALPATPVLAVQPSPVPGLYRVQVAADRWLYVDGSGRYLVMGLIFDLHTGQALDGALDGHASHAPALPAED